MKIRRGTWYFPQGWSVLRQVTRPPSLSACCETRMIMILGKQVCCAQNSQDQTAQLSPSRLEKMQSNGTREPLPWLREMAPSIRAFAFQIRLLYRKKQVSRWKTRLLRWVSSEWRNIDEADTTCDDVRHTFELRLWTFYRTPTMEDLSEMDIDVESEPIAERTPIGKLERVRSNQLS